jgi:hypothetical protein
MEHGLHESREVSEDINREQPEARMQIKKKETEEGNNHYLI